MIQSTSTLIPPASDLQPHCRQIVSGIADFRQVEGDFNPNNYFDLMTHLKLKEGYVLDSVMVEDGLGGAPVLYARQSTSKPFGTPEDLHKAMQAEGLLKETDSIYNIAQDYLRYVVPDGTPESYLELAILRLLGSQYNLIWHANYNDTRVLCDASDLLLVAEEVEAFTTELPADVQRKMKGLDLNPRVEMAGDHVVTRLLLFTKWGGFYEMVTSIDPTSPGKFSDVTRPLIKYECGIRF